MSERRLKLMEIREMIRHIREERSDRQIGRDLGVDRRTVKRYRKWAQEQGLLEGEIPNHQSLLKLLDETMPEKKPPKNTSSAEQYRGKIEEFLEAEVKVTAIYDRHENQGESLVSAADFQLKVSAAIQDNRHVPLNVAGKLPLRTASPLHEQ